MPPEDGILPEAAAPAPAGAAVAVSPQQAATLRRRQGDEWSAEDWLGYYDEKAAISEFDHGMSRQEAEEHAIEHCIAEWLYRHPKSSDANDGCPICGGADQPNNSLLPVGLGGGQVWLHRECSRNGVPPG